MSQYWIVKSLQNDIILIGLLESGSKIMCFTRTLPSYLAITKDHYPIPADLRTGLTEYYCTYHNKEAIQLEATVRGGGGVDRDISFLKRK